MFTRAVLCESKNKSWIVLYDCVETGMKSGFVMAKLLNDKKLSEQPLHISWSKYTSKNGLKDDKQILYSIYVDQKRNAFLQLYWEFVKTTKVKTEASMKKKILNRSQDIGGIYLTNRLICTMKKKERLELLNLEF